MSNKMTIAAVFAAILLWAMPARADFDYKNYSEFLGAYVRPGAVIDGTKVAAVAYAAIARDAADISTVYPRLLAQLDAFDPETLSTREEKIAFWINAYNIAAIKLVVDHYPVDSIRSMKINIFKAPWNKDVLTVGGRKYSLDTIEHRMLLGSLQEPKAHFAISCASVGCPDLRDGPYRADKLDAELDAAAKAFINSPKGVQIDRAQGVVRVSKVFDWGRDDFDKIGGVREIILWHIERLDDREYLKEGKYKLEYLRYDWKLNDLRFTGK